VVALAATFLSEHHGGPQLLYALLLGLSLNILASHDQLKAGITLCARFALRVGVALLGARITIDQITGLGLAAAATVAAAVAVTIASGLLLARLLGRPREEGILSGCAVGICGASAALAVSAVLPATRENERFTLLAVVGVTILSTVAMVLYPLGLSALGVGQRESGILLGGTVHDVAQVVAAAMMLGPEAADTAAIVKLFRVAMLAPVAMLIALAYRRRAAAAAASRQPPLIPGFLIGFACLVALASTGWVSPQAVTLAGSWSKWLLMLAIAGSGIKTNMGELAKLGWTPVVMLVVETVVIAVFTAAVIAVWRI
jgi:uncharacterized integral membrane protein (TIGR00698 family)